MFGIDDHVHQHCGQHDGGRSDLSSFWIIFAGGEYADEYALPYMKVFGNLIRFCESLDFCTVFILFLQLSKVGQ